MISFLVGIGIGVGTVFGVFIAVGLGVLVCLVIDAVRRLFRGKKHYGF